jgi:hypothetical protein
MNHTLYFKDEDLFLTFKQRAQHQGSLSDALNEAIHLWLQRKRTWPLALANMKPVKDDFRFESGRDEQQFEDRDYF